MTGRDRPIDLAIYSPVSRGGAGWFLSALTQSIADADLHVLLVAPAAIPASREPHGANVERDVLIAGKGGKASLPERVARTAWRIGSTFPALLRARLRTREIVVTLYDWIPVLVLQFLWIRLIGFRLTFIVHDATPHAWQLPPRLRGVERALFRLSYRLPHRVVSLTEALRAELATSWGRGTRSFVIPHGAYETGAPVAVPGEDVVLIFGMLRRNKNILEAVEAFRQVALEHPRLRLVIAGAPHAEDPDYWDVCAAALTGLEDRVRTEIGFVPEERLGGLLAECDAVLLPYDAFNSQSGVAVLAAFAERLLISSDAGGLAELIGYGLEPVTIRRPVDADAIADALRAFVALPIDERRQRAERSRARLAEHLGWPQIGRAYRALIETT